MFTDSYTFSVPLDMLYVTLWHQKGNTEAGTKDTLKGYHSIICQHEK